MSRQLRQRRYTGQPQGTFPKLRREFADAVLVYLPSVILNGFMEHGSAIANGTNPTLINRFGSRLADFNLSNSIRTLTGTSSGLNFSTSGLTVLAVGAYPDTGSRIQAIVNRGNAGQAGGFNVNYYNVFGPTPGSIFSSYNHPTTGDTNWDSAWVNGVKDSTGNGSYPTAIDTRYAFAGATAVGPATSTYEIALGWEAPGAVASTAQVEFVVVWPKRLSEQQLRRITADPYIVFEPPKRLVAADVAGGITAALTGVAATGAVGTVAPATSKGLTGNAGTGAVGSVGVTRAGSITGNAGAGSVGSVAPSAAKALTGNAGTAAAGTVAPNVTVALTGVAATGAVGTVTAGSAATAALTGVAATGGAGTVAPSTSAALTGNAASGAVGTVAPGTSYAITGNAATGSVGTVAGAVTVALSGVAGTGQVGTVTASGGSVTIALTGVSATGDVGSVAAPTTDRLGGFEMGGARIVSFKPLLQKIMEARAERVRPAKTNARKKARAIEVEAAQIALSDGNESEFRALMQKWLAQKPVMPAQEDPYPLFLAQVALQVRRIREIEQDEEEALIALLLL